MALETCDVHDTEELELQCEGLRKKLFESCNNGDEEHAMTLLKDILKCLNRPNEEKTLLLDTLCLPLCSPCVISSSLSTECAELVASILSDMSLYGPAREVFTGLTDGISSMMEDPFAGFTASLVPVTENLKTVVSRITRRREKFIVIALRLVLRLLDRLQDNVSTLDFSEVDFCKVAELGQSIVKMGDLAQEIKQAFALQLSSSLLCLVIWSSALEKTYKQAREKVVESIVPLWKDLDIQSVISEDQVRGALMKAWCEGNEDQMEDRMAIELEKSCGLLHWAAVKFPSFSELIPTSSEDADFHKWSMQLIKLPPAEFNSPYILAGLDLVEVTLIDQKVEDEGPDWNQVCHCLVNLMENHPLIALKMRAHSLLTSVLKESNEKMKWSLLSQLVFTHNDEVAALFVQILKAAIVDVFDNENHSSVFMSTEVCKLLDQLMEPLGGRKQWLQSDLLSRSGSLTAVVSIYLFLINRESKAISNYTGVCSESQLEKLKKLLPTLKEEAHKALQEENQERSGMTLDQSMSLQRMICALDCLRELLNRF